MTIAMGSNPANPEAIFNSITMGYLSKSVAGGPTVALSDLEAQDAVHEYTGTLAANTAVEVPAETKIYLVFNNTSGAYTLTVKTSAGSGVAVTQGNKVILVCDGTDVVAWSSEV